MNKVGRYCKAYMLDDFRQFSGWSADVREAGQDASPEANGTDETDLSDVLFLQENYTVTSGIFLEQDVVFDKVTPDWIEFCRETLKFDVHAIESSDGNSRPASEIGV